MFKDTYNSKIKRIITFIFFKPLTMINTLCVCGAGTMGSGIAQTAIQSGIYTLLYEPNEEVLKKAKAGIETNLQSLVDKGKIDEKTRNRCVQLIQYTNDVQVC
jgi:3-hydroxybutyryl-CoA dehydrogenase